MIRLIKRRISLGLLIVCHLLFTGCRAGQDHQTAGQSIDLAWQYYQLGEFGAAVEGFEHALEQSEPGSDDHVQALYGLGITWQLRRPQENAAKAAACFRQLIQESPGHELVAWSYLALARLEHLVPVGEVPDYEHVRDSYRMVMELFPRHPAGQEALIYHYATLAANLDPEDARTVIDAMDSYLTDFTNGVFTSAAWSLKAICHETLRMGEEKLNDEIMAFNSREIDHGNPNQDQAGRYWSLATAAEFDVGDFEIARVYYRRLIDEYPTDIRVFSCEKAIGRMNDMESRLRLDGQDIP
jgi:tetratricopeptide (TPR) repeat protein